MLERVGGGLPRLSKSRCLADLAILKRVYPFCATIRRIRILNHCSQVTSVFGHYFDRIVFTEGI
jgi:hypothetical protein